MAKKPVLKKSKSGVKTRAHSKAHAKQPQESLPKGSNFSKDLIKASPAFIIAINEKDQILLMNEAMLNTLGYSEEEVIGKDYLSLIIPKDEREEVSRDLDILVESQMPTKGVNHILSKDGQKFLVEWHGRTIMKPNGDMDFHFGIGIDITKRRRAELKLKDAFSEIKRLKDRLEAENIYLRREIKVKSGHRDIIGQSEAIKDVLRQIELVAGTDSTVLILGETGTGKELVAEALHRSGPREKGPLIKVNCSALSETILESELFGHVRGAFSGAIKDKIGRIQAAERGTLFLDEIGEISPHIQIKLLRFLDSREYERVGEAITRKADVRLVSATNTEMREKVQSGTLRSDLYYRLNIITIQLPPLREREGDITLLTDKFVNDYNIVFNKKIRRVDEVVRGMFLNHSWPGNVRELKHTVEHACLVCGGRTIFEEHLPKKFQSHMEFKGDQKTLHVNIEKLAVIGPEQIYEALKQAYWKKNKAAQLLGIHRSRLYRLMDRYGIPTK